MNDFVVIYGDELYHHGVLGMRWGHRKKPYKSYQTKINENRVKKLEQKLKNEKNTNKKVKIKNKLNRHRHGLRVNKLGDKVANNMTTSERLWYNRENFSRSVANKVINSGMTMEQAKKKTKRNFNIALGAIGAFMVADLVAQYKLLH